MKKIFNILFMFLILSLGVSAITITDNFNDNTLDILIWNITNTTSGTILINESNQRLEISGNATSGSLCTSGQAFIDTYAVVENGTEGLVEIEFRAITPPDNVNDHYIFGLTNNDNPANSWISSPPTYCGVIFDITGSDFRVLKNHPSASVVTTIKSIDSNSHDLKIIVGRVGGETAYGVYFDDVLEATVFQSGGCSDPTLKTDIVACVGDSPQYKLITYDNFEFEASVLSNGTGTGCYADSDCESGKCEAGFCVLKLGNEPCTSGTQCLSGVCTNGKCAKSDLIEQIDVVKGQWFGDSENTNNFISMFFMVGIPVMIIMGSQTVVAVLAGIIIYFGLGTFFTIIGWLSPFILILSIFGGMVVIVLAFMFKMGGE